jgi:site-specific recombinase XerD
MKNHILPYFGEMQLEEIITADISKFKHTLMQKNLTGNTINKCISCLKAIFEYAEENGHQQDTEPETGQYPGPNPL